MVEEQALVVSPCFDSEFESFVGEERIRHLVQDDELINSIHNEELPPDCYYQQLEQPLKKAFPGSTPEAREHVVALCAAFDTAAAFGLSFSCKKIQFLQKWVKLVGEIVGEKGRKPNPALCEAIRKWPPIKNLKDLQGFLGTTNYVRPHAGPAYAKEMAPLRPLLKADAVFPPNKAQLDAIEMMKKLVVEDHIVAVPDEKAAIAAARAWMNGDPPTGCPYEMGADTSKIAMGGVMGQAQTPRGRLMPLQYFSAPL